MTKEERLHRYSMLGIVAFVEEQVKGYKRANDGIAPTTIVVGRLEWETMGCEQTTEWSVCGVRVIPNDANEFGVTAS